MIDLARIRNASFTLTPTGYNPEEVDRFLTDLADQLAESINATPAQPRPELQAQPEPQVQTEPTPLPPAPALAVAPAPVPAREEADLDGLRLTIERTISAMDGFVNHELASLRAATELETDEIHRERERLLDEAAAAASAHLEETRVRAESILAEARRDGDTLRAGVEGELRAERERFEHELADLQAEARARAAEIVADADRRRAEADELVAGANRVQTQVLASLEQARASLFGAEPAVSEPQPEAPAGDQDASAADNGVVEDVHEQGSDEGFAIGGPADDRFGGASDAAA